MFPAILALTALGLALPVGAQENAPAPQEPPAEKAAAAQPAAETESPKPIPAAEIAQRAENLTTRLREIRGDLQPSKELANIQTALTGLEKEVEASRTDLEKLQEPTLTLVQLEDLRQPWDRYRRQLEEWQAAIDARTTRLAAIDDALTRAGETWRLTGERPGGEKLPDVLAQRVRTTREEIGRVRQVLDDRLSAVLTLQDQVVELRRVALDAIASLSDTEGELRSLLFKANRAPLWRALLEPGREAPLLRQIADSWGQDATALRGFARRKQEALTLHGSIFVALLVLVLVLHGKVRRWALESASMEAAAHIVSRPVAVAFLVSLYLRPLLYPDAPIQVMQLYALLALLPVARLLPGLVRPSLRGPLYGLIALLALQQAVNLTLEDSLLQRWGLLAVTLLALGWLAVVLRPGGSASRVEGGPWWQASLRVCRASALLLLVSAGANVLGFVNLAELLTGATLNASRIGIVLFVTFLVLQGLLEVLVSTRHAHLLGMFRNHRALWVEKGSRFLRLLAVTVWSWAVLIQFRLWSPIVKAGGAVLAREWKLGSLQISLGAVLAFGIVVWLSVLISRFLRFALDEDVLPRLDLPRGVPSTISTAVNYAVIAIGLLIAMAAAGIEMTKFAIIAGALGVGIGFGLQTLVNNFVSGLILIFERPIQMGDTVEVGTLLGRVRRIGIRASVIRTFSGAEVIVPNGNLLAEQVVNWTHSDFLRRMEIDVGVAYGSDPHKVIELLRETATAHEKTLKEPAPDVMFLGFGDSSLDFQVRVWTADFESWLATQSEIVLAIHDALYREGIEIPFPQRDLHLRSVDPDLQKTFAPGRSE